VYSIDAPTMRATRIKAAKHIHEQKKKSGMLQSGAIFNAADVDLTNVRQQRRRDLRHERAQDGLC
jgi:hypothetical protein